jgi:hypothetical protein
MLLTQRTQASLRALLQSRRALVSGQTTCMKQLFTSAAAADPSSSATRARSAAVSESSCSPRGSRAPKSKPQQPELHTINCSPGRRAQLVSGSGLLSDCALEELRPPLAAGVATERKQMPPTRSHHAPPRPATNLLFELRNYLRVRCFAAGIIHPCGPSRARRCCKLPLQILPQTACFRNITTNEECHMHTSMVAACAAIVVASESTIACNRSKHMFLLHSPPCSATQCNKPGFLCTNPIVSAQHTSASRTSNQREMSASAPACPQWNARAPP